MLPIILAAVGTYLIADSQKQKFANGGEVKDLSNEEKALFKYLIENWQEPFYRNQMDAQDIRKYEKLVKKGLIIKGGYDNKIKQYYSDNAIDNIELAYKLVNELGLDETIGGSKIIRAYNYRKNKTMADGGEVKLLAPIRFAKGGKIPKDLQKDLQDFLNKEFYEGVKYKDVSNYCDLAKGNCYDISEELMAYLKNKGYQNMTLIEVREPLFDLSKAHNEWKEQQKESLFHIILKVDKFYIDLTGIQYQEEQIGLKIYTKKELEKLWGKIESFD